MSKCGTEIALHYGHFSDLIAAAGITPREYPRSSDAIEAAELLVTVEELGDRVLNLMKDDQLPVELGTSLIEGLKIAYADPLKDTRSIIMIGNELKGYGR